VRPNSWRPVYTIREEKAKAAGRAAGCGMSFILLANSDALSARYHLDRGNVLRSPAARLFLDRFGY